MQFPKLNFSYPKKRAIITGAGSGLGLALTQLLVANEWHVLAIDLQCKALENLGADLVEIHAFDITNRSLFESCIVHFCTRHDGVDILFNNAGVGEGTLFQNYDLTHWDWIIDVNLKSVIAATHVVLPFLQKANAGCIVNMASMAGIANLPKMSPYNVTKAGVISLSETLSHELSKTNIHVTCVTPTFFQSSILQHSKGDQEIVDAAQKIVSASKLSSRDAAIIILNKLHANSETIRFPKHAHLFFYGRRLFPKFYKFIVRKFLMK